MPITIQPDLEAMLLQPADAAGVTVETYIERIARDDQDAEKEVEALAIEGLNSGPSIAPDEAYWAAKRQQLIDGYRNSRGQ
ncbi:MAG: hypothetical protein EXQ57_02715 [Bryobacterales bacterium]|nr:hypothetical protein [Bryobacterales bacterium]